MRITESQLNKLVKKIVNEKDYGQIQNYMFFSNLEQMVRQAQLLLELDPMEVEQILQGGHDWADDHITVAKENLSQVFDFMMNETQHNDEYEEDEEMVMMEGKKKLVQNYVVGEKLQLKQNLKCTPPHMQMVLPFKFVKVE